MNFAAHITEMQQHVERLARTPGWDLYVKDKAARMAKAQPAMYGHYPDIVAKTLAARAAQPQEKRNAVPA